MGVLLLASFVRQQTSLPLNEPQYLALKDQLARRDQPAVREQLRELDQRLRERYFRRQVFVRRGAYLLAGGLLATSLLWQWAFTVQRRLPLPKNAPSHNQRERQHRQAQWACGAVVLVLVGMIGVWRASSPSVLAGGEAPLELASPSSELTSDSAPPPAPVQAEAPPTREQLAANWHRFRGSHGAGVSPFTDVPRQWNGTTGDGVLWKTAIPLPGASSPVVWEERVFLTGANEQRREVVLL